MTVANPFITQDLGTYQVYDKFFAQWMLQQ